MGFGKSAGAPASEAAPETQGIKGGEKAEPRRCSLLTTRFLGLSTVDVVIPWGRGELVGAAVP